MSLTPNTTKHFVGYVYSLALSFVLVLPLAANSAEQIDTQNATNDKLVTVSVGLNQVSKQSDIDYRQESIQLTKSKALALIAPTNISREEKNASRKELAGQKNKKNKAARSINYHHSFTIYNAFSYLLDDYDLDGYYQTFSVVFDADLLNAYTDDSAGVYAELYLSQNGGPWIYYYTTDNFIIYGDSEDDEYEVITTLHQGYSSDNYDVLIDLYEVGYDDIVATYSSDDNNALYALPLESSDVDIEYIVEVYDGHAGSMSVYLLLIVFIIRLAFKAPNSQKH